MKMSSPSDNFVNIPISIRNLDRWIVRSSILEAMRGVLPSLSGSLVDIGCGKMPYRELILAESGVREYVGVDIEGAREYSRSVKPDVVWDGRSLPLSAQRFDCALATEVFEHTGDLSGLLSEIRRVLRPGGLLFFTTPFVWPYHEVPHDHQRWTSFGLRSKLEAAGFKHVEVRSVGGWHSTLAQMLGLWVSRAPMSRPLRYALRYPVLATQRLLVRHDCAAVDVESSMPRLLTGTART